MSAGRTDRASRKPNFAAALAIGALAFSLGAPPAGPQDASLQDCRSGEPPSSPRTSSQPVPNEAVSLDLPSPSVRWDRPTETEDRLELDRWCRAVGPPAVHRPPAHLALPRGGASGSRALLAPLRGATLPVDDGVAIVAWNTHVGGGDLDRFVEDLRAGRLTGRPVRHFVLLLQEVYRTGETVPDSAAGTVRGADRVTHPVPDRRRGSVDEVARRHDLHLFYAPSMRNGHIGQEEELPAEDRGNALLATLPLTDLQILELPVRNQRRIVIAATIGDDDSPAGPWSLRVVNVHLDHISNWRRFHRSFGQDRAAHARLLVDTFGQEDAVAVGGDFNSWFGGARESGVRLMRAHFPLPLSPPTDDTLLQTVVLFSRQVDHLFFRLPETWSADYRIVPDGYGSDHLPLVGWVRPGRRGASPAGGGSVP